MRCLFCEKASLWPGSKGVARKKHRPSYSGLRIADFGFFDFLFQSALRNRHSAIWRRAYRAPLNSEFGILFFFLTIPHSAFYIPHFGCPPDPENEPCLMVFARNALAFGPGNGRNSIGLTITCRKVKVGKKKACRIADPPLFTKGEWGGFGDYFLLRADFFVMPGFSANC